MKRLALLFSIFLINACAHTVVTQNRGWLVSEKASFLVARPVSPHLTERQAHHLQSALSTSLANYFRGSQRSYQFDRPSIEELISHALKEGHNYLLVPTVVSYKNGANSMQELLGSSFDNPALGPDQFRLCLTLFEVASGEVVDVAFLRAKRNIVNLRAGGAEMLYDRLFDQYSNQLSSASAVQ